MNSHRPQAASPIGLRTKELDAAMHSGSQFGSRKGRSSANAPLPLDPLLYVSLPW